MAKGPFYNLKTRYTLAFPGFSIQAHLKSLNTFQAAAAGLDVEGQNLEALCCDPMEGHPGLRHDLTATVTPSWMGLEGTFIVKGRPESRLLPVVDAVGVKLWGEFTELASSASNDMTPWTRRRRTSVSDPDGLFDRGQWANAPVMLYVAPEKGDELDPLGPVRVAVTAVAGTLLEGDLITDPLRGTYQIRELAQDGQFEHARAER